MKFLRSYVTALGAYCIMLKDMVSGVYLYGLEFRETVRQIYLIGVNSVPIVFLTGLFTGMVLALQTAYGLQRFGAKNYVGNITGLGFVRELGPVLTAIIVCGRMGAGIAAELSSMLVTEQIDAMRSLGADPVSKLVTPKILAAAISTPLLVVVANTVGMYGGLLVAVYELDLTAHQYYRSLVYTLVVKDIFDGVVKGVVFGFLVVSIACYKGLTSKGGTQGVGLTTTSAVVTGSVAVFVSDFFITKLLIIMDRLAIG
jgi:phospholipid/cholesterol/gamma-HCH transport system permease protein